MRFPTSLTIKRAPKRTHRSLNLALKRPRLQKQQVIQPIATSSIVSHGPRLRPNNILASMTHNTINRHHNSHLQVVTHNRRRSTRHEVRIRRPTNTLRTIRPQRSRIRRSRVQPLHNTPNGNLIATTNRTSANRAKRPHSRSTGIISRHEHVVSGRRQYRTDAPFQDLYPPVNKCPRALRRTVAKASEDDGYTSSHTQRTPAIKLPSTTTSGRGYTALENKVEAPPSTARKYHHTQPDITQNHQSSLSTRYQ